MKSYSSQLRRRAVAAYRNGETDTYEETASMFGVGVATINRWLRRIRETGDVKEKPRGGNNPRRVDLEWLREHANAHPDARLVDRIAAWETKSGVRISIRSMWRALRVLGFTHKKRRPWHANETGSKFKRNGRVSSWSNRSSM